MVRYEGEEPVQPTKLDHVILRILDSIRRNVEKDNVETVISLTNELIDLAMVYAEVKRKKSLIKLKKMEDFVISMAVEHARALKLESTDIYGRGDRDIDIEAIVRDIRWVFSKMKKRLALAALSEQGLVYASGVLIDLRDIVDELTADLNSIFSFYGLNIRLSTEDVKKMLEVEGGGSSQEGE